MTKYLVVSDVHGYIDPLERVLTNADLYQEIWFLGDVIGHDAMVSADSFLRCYSLLYKFRDKIRCVIGNWEYWILNPQKDKDENSPQYIYREYLQARREELKNAGLYTWIAEWPEKIDRDEFAYIHGSPSAFRDPTFHTTETYILPQNGKYVSTIFLNKMINRPHLLFAHTHQPGYFRVNCVSDPQFNTLQRRDLDKPFDYEGKGFKIHYAINPGSISQNRKIYLDNELVDPGRTALVIDTEKKTFTFIEVK